ncbi:B3 domain-containing protein At4g34400 [Eutrema salsugineum]|uniref:B3 domain-containing protein At4g34400 n=1 Tax=Eutrema salsugineum TaxID=72664 RepID=UPI000CED4638|nr:B3 domain-containing protein At4g34400 [Eutrema salsugineum]
MADTDTPPRFFKVFISHFSSNSMLIPISYYDELPPRLPKTAILRGTGGCSWNVAMKRKQDEVYFEQGWVKFVKDNSLSDGDFLTFVYNGDRIFEVSIYGPDGCKEVRAVTEADDDEEDSSNDTDAISESEVANTIPRTKNKGKSKVEVVEEESDDDEEDSIYADTETETGSKFKMAKTIPRSINKGKMKEEVVEGADEDSDSDYNEAFGGLDFEENFNSDSSYAPDSEDTATYVEPKVKNLKKKGFPGKSKLTEDVDVTSDSVKPPKKRRERVKPKIKNPEAYLDNPRNVYFETGVKKRRFELLVHAQLVKDYSLKFEKNIYFIDNHNAGKLLAETAVWNDERVCIKGWQHICERNQVKKEDGILCELFRKRELVYAIKVHIIKAKDL